MSSPDKSEAAGYHLWDAHHVQCSLVDLQERYSIAHLVNAYETMQDSVEDEDLSGIDPDLLSQGKKKGVTRRTGMGN
jgi:hypothetical protein